MLKPGMKPNNHKPYKIIIPHFSYTGKCRKSGMKTGGQAARQIKPDENDNQKFSERLSTASAASLVASDSDG